MTDTHIAKLMWDAYAIQAGGKTFDGKPLPTWDELGEERQACWVAAASVTADRIEKLEAALRILANITDCDTEGKLPVDTKLTWARQKLFDVRQLARKALDAK
jgi:hypothetical protein